MGRTSTLAERFQILVVEDDLSLQLALVRAIDRTESLKGIGASSVVEAKREINRHPPDVVVTDLRLGEACGLELISFLDRKAPGTPVIVVSAFRQVFEEELLQHQDLKILEKPVSLSLLRQEVLSRTAQIEKRPIDETPKESSFQVTDYLQLASLGNRTLALNVQTQAEENARVEIVEGEIWNVELGMLNGRPALNELLGNTAVEIEWEALDSLPSARELYGSTEHFLLDFARVEDESSRDEDYEDEALGFGEIFSIEEVAEELPELSEALSRSCNHLVSRVAGARMAAVVSLSARRMLGGAGKNNPLTHEIQKALTEAVVEVCQGRSLHRLEKLFSEAEGVPVPEDAGVQEIRLYIPETVYFIAALEDPDLVAVLVAEPFLKQGLGWMALKKAMPEMLLAAKK